ncbi:hypothetical protein [Tautonia marina]|uniref:hypothetical protein n=1 Tax=Tautonia marina TaxID=2653855 RepID=UPI001260F9F6|nr:hypothetical protein [Tautonia marina]
MQIFRQFVPNFALMVVIIITGFFCIAHSANAALPVATAVQTKDSIDKNSIEYKSCFMLYFLDHMYRTWPSSEADAVVLEDWLRGNYNLLGGIIGHTRPIDKYDREIITLYSECESLINEYYAFLDMAGIIHITGHKPNDGTSIAIDAIGRGMEATAFIKMAGTVGVGTAAVFGMTAVAAAPVTALALTGGVIVGVASGLAESNANRVALEKMDEEKRRTLQNMARRLNNKFTSNYIRTQESTKVLAEQFGWEKITGYQERLHFSPNSEMRWENPFALMADAGDLSRSDEDESAYQRMHRALQCERAASLVPSAEVFDSVRAGFLAVAASYASSAASIRFREVGTLQRDGIRDDAIRINRAALQALVDLDDNPSTNKHLPDVRFGLASCYLAVDDHASALRYANQALEEMRNDKYFAYFYSCVMSRRGNLDSSLKWLQHAYNHGFATTSWVFDDPRMHATRYWRVMEYYHIVYPKHSIDVSRAILGDDTATIKNNSMYDIHDIDIMFEYKCNRNEGQEDPCFSKLLWTDGILAGSQVDFKVGLPCPEVGTSSTRLTKCRETDYDHDFAAAYSEAHLNDNECYKIGNFEFKYHLYKVDELHFGEQSKDLKRLRDVAAHISGKSHAANTTYIRSELAQGQTALMQTHEITTNRYTTMAVHRGLDGDWYVSSDMIAWNPMDRREEFYTGGPNLAGILTYAQAVLPGHWADNIDSERQAIREDSTFCYRFLAFESYRPIVTSIRSGSLAERLGIEPGDYIKEYNKNNLYCLHYTCDCVADAVESGKTSNTVSLVIERQGKIKEFTIPGGSSLGISFERIWNPDAVQQIQHQPAEGRSPRPLNPLLIDPQLLDNLRRTG